MNLNQTMEMYAGGPGSGPHPGNGVSDYYGKHSGKITDKHGVEYDVYHKTRVDDDGNTRHSYHAFSKEYGTSAPVVSTDLTRSGKSAMSVQTTPEFRRRGLATALYDHIGQDLGKPLVPNDALTPDGEALWKSREQKK